MNRRDRGAPPALGACEPENAVRSTRRWREMDSNDRFRGKMAPGREHRFRPVWLLRPRLSVGLFALRRHSSDVSPSAEIEEH